MRRRLSILLCTTLLGCSLLCACSGKESEQETTKETVNETTIETTIETIIETTVTETASEEESVAATVEETSEQNETSTEEKAGIPDGIYTADFDTDSSMFHVSEACDGKGTLTVQNGEMTIHISLASKKILNLYPGMAEDAAKEGAELLMPTEDTVTYSDGLTEVVYGFDVPVPALDEEFDLALIGTKGIWYDHKVKVSNPEPLDENVSESDVQIEDGTYTVELAFEGGSGKAQILSPATVTVTEGVAMATVQWNSPNYDYMLVDGEKYLPINTEGDSVFEIPVLSFDTPMSVIGDTVAMSKPHEIEYTLTFYSDTMHATE